MTLWFVLATLLFGRPSLQVAPPNGASIVGSVVGAADNRPLAGARVILLSFDSQPTIRVRETREAITDEEGRFEFSRLEAQNYELHAEKNSYLPSAFSSVALATGEQRNAIVFRLTSAGVITGRISDDRGDPVVGLPVELGRPYYNVDGVRNLGRFNETKTDDRGDYRLYGITPGQYYLRVGPSPSGSIRRDFGNLYLPEGSRTDPTILLDVTAGSPLVADFRIAPSPRYNIKGRVVLQEQAPTGVSVTVGGYEQDKPCLYKQDDQSFQCVDLLPGRYFMRATLSRTPQRTVTQPVTIDSASVENLVLRLGAAPLAGRVLLDDKDFPPESEMEIQLTNDRGPTFTPPAKVKNARFEYSDLTFGVYRVQLPSLPSGTYLMGMRFNGEPVIGNAISFSGAAGDELQILLSSKGGQLQGQVTDARLAPVSGASVVLIPASERTTHLYRSVVTPKDGRFVLTGIAPGDYEVYPWEAIQGYEYFDPMFIDRWRGRGTKVHIGESSSETLNLQVLR